MTDQPLPAELVAVLERLETAAAAGTGYLADEARSILSDYGYDEGPTDEY